MVGPNEFTDFEQIEVEHLKGTTSMARPTSANHPGDGITLRQNRSTSHVKQTWARLKAMKFAPARTPERFSA